MNSLKPFLAISLSLVIANSLSCKKGSNPQAAAKTVLTGYYSVNAVYTINSNGTYTAKQKPACLANFSLFLTKNSQMQLQDACLNVTGTWTYANNALTITAASGTVEMSGPVEFETDGITIDVNSTVDNTRYQLFRN